MPESRAPSTEFETFRGRDVAEALARVRSAFGRDALIGDTRMVSNGMAGSLGHSVVEVKAARAATPSPSSKFSRDAMQLDNRAPAVRRHTPAAMPAARLSIGTGAPHRSPSIEGDIGLELRLVRSLLQEVVATKKPRDRALAMLDAAGIEGALAYDLSSGLPKAARADTDSLRNALRARLGARLRVTVPLLEQPGPRLIACVGPTGVGKTTTLAKLAARAQIELGRKVAVISLDTFRVGAVEQMRRFAELIGVPFALAQDRTTFAQALRARPADLVLVDTPSRAPTDSAALSRLLECLSTATDHTVNVLLAVAASIRASDVERLAPLFDACPLAGLVITKLDETSQAGGAVHVALRGPTPIAYLCNGPRVPEDLHDATVEAVADAVLPLDR
jgi:flagellar biosynthesis protein FlhF